MASGKQTIYNLKKKKEKKNKGRKLSQGQKEWETKVFDLQLVDDKESLF